LAFLNTSFSGSSVTNVHLNHLHFSKHAGNVVLIRLTLSTLFL
jgi:hypothetical protein